MAGAETGPARRRGEPFSFEFIRLPDRRSTYESTLVEASDRHIILEHRITPSVPLVYRGEVVLGSDYRAVWFLFKDQPFDVARVYRPDGVWTGYYADVLEPVHWDGDDPHTLLPLADLFLDLWVAPDGEFEVLDEDELRAAVAEGAITGPLATQARDALGSMTEATRRGDFPPKLARDFRP